MTGIPLRTRTEIVLESAVERDNPYLDVHTSAVFIGPSGETIRRDAFWDGGRTWRIRFMPTSVGRWSYRVESDAVDDPGLHGVTGLLDATSADALGGVPEHGILRVSDTGRHLSYDDGTPFFWLGDTHWRFAWERWDESNKPGWDSQFRGTVDHRVAQGYTVYQSNLMSFGRGWDVFPGWEEGAPFARLIPEYFRDTIDPRMDYVAESGLVNAFGIGWYRAIDLDPDGLVRFAKYLVARYGAAPMVWTLGGEVGGFDPAQREQRLESWRRVALAIRNADDYRHPITAHLTNERPIPDYYQNEEWLDFTLNQLGHGDLDMRASVYDDHFALFGDRPMVEGESMYEGITTVEPVARRTADALIVRQVAYRAIQAGCCGYTYGAQGCWNNAWEYGDSSTTWGDLPWYEGVDLAGGEQLGHLRRFYEELSWWSLRPDRAAFASTSAVNNRYFPPAVSADAERRTVVSYFGETYRSEDGVGSFVGLTASTYLLRWFDPRTGERRIVSERIAPVDGRIELPATPTDGEDYLLVATALEDERPMR